MFQSGGHGGEDNSSSPIMLQPLTNLQQLLSHTSDRKIFLDPNSPYHKAPQSVQDLLRRHSGRDQCLECDDIDLNTLNFERKESMNNLCMYYFETGVDGYYHCLQCTNSDWDVQRVIFCVGCFQPNKHQGHKFYFQKCRRQQDFCDCGSKSKTNLKSSPCCKHNQDLTIPINIDEKDRKNFLEIFSSLVEVAIYVDQNSSLIQKIVQKLLQLNRNSPYYGKLTLQLLKMESKYLEVRDQFRCKYFIVFFSYCVDIKSLIFLIAAHNELCAQLVRFIGTNYEVLSSPNRYHSAHINNQLIKLVCDYKILQNLANKNQYLPKLFKIYQQFSIDLNLARRNMFAHFLQNWIGHQKKITMDLLLQNGLSEEYITTIEIAWICLKMLIDSYPNKKKKKTIKYSSPSNGSNSKTNRNKARQRVLYNQQQIDAKIKKVHSMILRCVLILTQADPKKIQNFRQNFHQKNICSQKFSNVLNQIAYYANQYFFNNETKETPAMSMILFTSLIKKDEDSSILLAHMWLSLIGKSNSFQFTAANIFEVVSAFVWSKTHIAIFQGIDAKIKKHTKGISERQSHMKYFFAKYLQLRGIIPRQQLIQMRCDDLLQFEQAGKILRTVCTYNEQDEAFYFNSTPLEEKFEDRFVFAIEETTVGTMSSLIYANRNIYYNFQKQEHISSEVLQFLQFALNNQLFEKLVLDIWDQFETVPVKSNSRQDQVKVGYLYLFTLLTINGFTKGQRYLINEIIQDLKKNPNKLKQYSKSQDQLEMINRLFCVKQGLGQIQIVKGDLKQNEKENYDEKMDIQNQKTQNLSLNGKQSEQIQKRKQKFMQKRKQFKKKFQQKRTAMLNKIKPKSIDVAVEQLDQEVCLFCHQKSKKNNQLIYLARIIGNKSLTQAIHGQNQKSNINIYTCFHTLHINCYIEKHKGSRMTFFQCPLCNTVINCFLMRSYKKQNTQFNNIFNSVLITSMVTNSNIYNIDNPFMLFFRHMVQARGLAMLIDYNQNSEQTKITDRNDHFIMSLLESMYEAGDQGERLRYLKNIDGFVNTVMECGGLACRYVQLCVAEAVKSRFTGVVDQLCREWLCQLKQVIKNEQFTIIKSQVQRIVRKQIQIPQHPQSLPLFQPPQKTSLTFTLKQIPKDSTKFTEFILQHQCSHHNTKMDFYCLICGKGVCEECNDQKNELEHSGISAYLDVKEFRLHLRNCSLDEEYDVYYSDFRVSFVESQEYNMEGEVYWLDVIRMQGYVQRFLQQ